MLQLLDIYLNCHRSIANALYVYDIWVPAASKIFPNVFSISRSPAIGHYKQLQTSCSTQ